MPIISKRKLITNVAAYAPAVSAFTPASLPGLVAWYDASVTGSFTKNGGGAISNGDIVGTWADQSGHGYTLTGNSVSAPVYQSAGFNSTKPCVFWDGLDIRGFVTATSVTHFNSGTAASFFVVCRIDTKNGRFASFAVTGSAFDVGAADIIFLFDNGGNLALYSSGVVGSVAYSTGTNYRLGSSLDATDSDIYVNNTGTDDAGGGSTFTSTGAIAIGCRQANNLVDAASLAGAVSEIVIGNQVWTPAQFTSLYTYAGTKWGL